MKFLDIEITKKIYIRLLIIFVSIIIAYMALTMSSILIFKSYTLGPNTSVNDEGMNTHIDFLETSSKKIEIYGWAYKNDEPLTTIKSSYIIKNNETGKMYLMKTAIEENINVSEEYKMAGIHAQCLTFGIPKGEYEIFVLYQGGDNDILASTGINFEL